MKIKVISKKTRPQAEPFRITAGEKFLPVQTSNRQDTAQKPAQAVQLLRTRVATAAAKLAAAKRRRKEAKRAARETRKQVKQAKAALAKAKQALTVALEKLVKPRARAATRKLGRTKAMKGAKPIVTARKKKATPARKSRPVPTIPSPASGPTLQVTPPPLPESAPTAGSLIEKSDSETQVPATPAASPSESSDKGSI